MAPKQRSKNQIWCLQPLTPLLEAPGPDHNGQRSKETTSWEAITSWVRLRMERRSLLPARMDLRLVLGILGCPLAPIPFSNEPSSLFSIKNNPVLCSAGYIVHQYLAATGCLKSDKCVKSMYVAGSVRIACSGSEGGGRGGGPASGCFVLWQMSPGMWLVEMVVAGYKVVAGSNGKIVWRHVPGLGMNAARGPRRPLRRIVQGLDPKCTASMFAKAQCLGEKRIAEDDCFVLKVTADRETVSGRGEEPAEVIRHVLYGYFSQKSGLLVYIEDSHLTRVQTPGSGAIYWETTIGSTMEDYRDVDGILIAQRGTSVATLYRFGESSSAQESRTRMEEAWRIDDVAFNVPGLSIDCFIPPVEVLGVVDGS